MERKAERAESAGFGFLVLFNGRLYKELKRDPSALGQKDASAAVETAKREGFPPDTIIFLDIEEGGRMLPEQKSYIMPGSNPPSSPPDFEQASTAPEFQPRKGRRES